MLLLDEAVDADMDVEMTSEPMNSPACHVTSAQIPVLISLDASTETIRQMTLIQNKRSGDEVVPWKTFMTTASQLRLKMSLGRAQSLNESPQNVRNCSPKNILDSEAD